MAVMLANALAVNQSTVLHLYCYEHTEVQWVKRAEFLQRYLFDTNMASKHWHSPIRKQMLWSLKAFTTMLKYII
jgi:hypothetical protein